MSHRKRKTSPREKGVAERRQSPQEKRIVAREIHRHERKESPREKRVAAKEDSRREIFRADKTSSFLTYLLTAATHNGRRKQQCTAHSAHTIVPDLEPCSLQWKPYEPPEQVLKKGMRKKVFYIEKLVRRGVLDYAVNHSLKFKFRSCIYTSFSSRVPTVT